MKIIAIGDIHGRNNWKAIADLDILYKTPNLATDYDKYIFLGDYVDSYVISNDNILQNLQDIIQLKKNYPDKIILLLGNHDLMYMFNYEDHACSGFRPEMYDQLHKLFNDNKDLFLPIYRINNYLFSHAGITTVWWKNFIKSIDYKPEYAIDDVINNQFKKYNKVLFWVGFYRGGYHLSGGPFWADKAESSAWVLPNYHQIVGHHPVGEVMLHKMDDNSTVTYCDNNRIGSTVIII